MPQEPSCVYQVKWDGMRLLAYWDGVKLLLQGKSLKDKTASYPELAVLPELVKGQSFLLDGELISLKGGKPCFFTLMQRENSSPFSRIPVYYMVFDLLLLDGTWLLERPWEARQELLQNSLEKHDLVSVTKNYADGKNLLEAVAERGMEGVVTKKRGTPYVPGPRKSSYWIKTKLQQTLEACVGGIYLKGKKPISLLLGVEENSGGDGAGKVRYIGSVSSGLTETELDLWLQWGLENSSDYPLFFNPPPKQPGRNILWVKPVRRVQVLFSEWTPGLKLRSPRIKHCPA
ncbi:MAG: hypothetical protein GXZ07_04140 [Firmicutes bacterium]|nr:hypothetical protein [Bacillota bacterium]